jgi:hypothetical protein
VTLPDFLLLGAAKAGTTSLMSMLAHHPDVFVAPVKECHHFLFGDRAPDYRGPGDEALNRRVVRDPAAYEDLFGRAEGAGAVGEASVFYLAHPEAFPEMVRRLDRPRAVVVLRDPVQRAVSAYGHLRRDGRELAPTLEEGLAAEQSRRAAGWEPLWHYERLGRYAEQVEALFDVFGRDRVHLVRYDDLQQDAARALAGVCRFLRVRDDVALPLRRENVSGQVRSDALHALLTRPGALKRALRPVVPAPARQRLFDYVQARNLRPLPGPDERVLADLADAFAPDVAR